MKGLRERYADPPEAFMFASLGFYLILKDISEYAPDPQNEFEEFSYCNGFRQGADKQRREL
jgi:hypothetical protein